MDLANMNQTASLAQPHSAVLSQPDPLQVGGVSLNSRLFLEDFFLNYVALFQPIRAAD